MAFTLAHLSDPHLAPLPAPRWRDLAGKRALGYLNWTRNRHKDQRREVLDALVADMQAQRPDHIAVTGDLVNIGAGGGIRAGAGLAGERRDRPIASPSCPAITTPMCAVRSTALLKFAEIICAATAR